LVYTLVIFFRLLEGIVAGACVFTDVMLTLPRGLKNGTSIVEYTSARNLQDLILYYLQHDDERIRVAKAGRDVAMRWHRSWHRMEEVLFGRPVTVCRPNQDVNVCNPYVVHAKDMYPKRRTQNVD
jgi:spore maturation protein CgeB